MLCAFLSLPAISLVLYILCWFSCVASSSFLVYPTPHLLRRNPAIPSDPNRMQTPPDTPDEASKKNSKMAEAQSHTDETQQSAGANVPGSGAASGGVSVQGSQKKIPETKRTPPKLQKKGSQQNTPKKETQKAGDSEQEPSQAPETNSTAPSQPQSRAQSKRRGSRGRGRSQAPESDTDSIVRSDVSDAQGGRRNRNRKKKPTKEAAPPQTNQSNGGPLDSLDEVGETTSGALDKVQDTAGGATDTAGQAVGGAKDQVGKTVGGLTGGGKKDEGKEGKGEGKGEQLRLRIELNLDLEIQLKAKINGDITIGLLN